MGAQANRSAHAEEGECKRWPFPLVVSALIVLAKPAPLLEQPEAVEGLSANLAG